MLATVPPIDTAAPQTKEQTMTTIHYITSFSKDPIVPTVHAPINAISSFTVGLWEGFLAYRRFEELTSSRVCHDTALRLALEGRSHRPSSTVG